MGTDAQFNEFVRQQDEKKKLASASAAAQPGEHDKQK
jgi:hypothetical protein